MKDSQPDSERREETSNPGEDRQPLGNQCESQKTSHQRHLAYGTWVLAIGTLILALLAYRALRDNQDALSQGQRAWVGPNQGSHGSMPSADNPNVPAVFSLQYQNPGREPALNVTSTLIPIISTLGEYENGKLKERILNEKAKCLRTENIVGGSTIFPSYGSPPYLDTIEITATSNDWDIIYGRKILAVEGCFVYTTRQMTHRSAFCFFWQAGRMKGNVWFFCPDGNYAD